MPKFKMPIKKTCILAFFICYAFFSSALCAQDVNTLENGLRFVIKEDHKTPLVVFCVLVNTGSASETEYAGSGICHLIEHMLFKGTKKYPPGSIEDILNKYGGKIEGWTSYDYTGFSITILKEYKKVALDVLKEMLTAPLFDQGEFKKEMDVIKREMDLVKDDPPRRISYLMFSTAYISHPYRMPVIGYKDIFERLTREDLLKFFKSRYTPQNITMAIVGDIEKEGIYKDMQDYFGRIPRVRIAPVPETREPEQVIERFLEEKAGIEGAYLNVAFHSSSLLDKELYALDLLSFILGQGESSILNERLRMQERIALSVSAYNYTPKDPGLFVVSALVKEEHVKAALDGILTEIENIKTNGVKEGELAKAKNNFLAGYIYQKETIESQADDFAESLLLTGSPDFFKKYIESIKSVTAGAIQSAATQYLKKENMTVVILSKSGKSLTLAMEPAIEKQKELVKKIALQNGLPIIVSENHSLPIVSLCILFKGGLLIENKDNNGISLLASSMLMDGTSSLTRGDIARLYESKGITISPYSGNNSLGISATCLKEHLEETLELIANLCTDPVFPDEELNREKHEMTAAIDMQDNDIFNHGLRLLKKMLFKSHPYGFQTIGTYKSIQDITQQTLAEFYQKILSSDNMAIGISGDITLQGIVPLVEKYFSGINLKKHAKDLPEKELPINSKIEEKIKVDKDQSLVLAGFHGTDMYSGDRYAIGILVNILSSPSGILFKNIREENGLSYAVGAFNVLGIQPGYITVYAFTSKENMPETENIIFKTLGSIIKNGISPEELEKSKNYLKAMRKIEMQTNASFIFAVSMDEIYGLGYNNYKDFDKNIDGVTEEGIKKVAKKYLTLDKCAVLILEGK